VHGDFSRLTFNSTRHYSSVLYQQGRPALDADANEQAAILLHHQRTLAADLVGQYAGPFGACGFGITPVAADGGDPPDLGIGAGRYYVGGMLVEADAPPDGDGWRYFHQPDAYPDSKADALATTAPYLVYLRVFEQLVTADDQPVLRESALGPNGPDTAARARVVWQVLVTDRTLPWGDKAEAVPAKPDAAKIKEAWLAWDTAGQNDGRGTLSVEASQPSSTHDEVCIASPDAGYRGLENQLYRVEIHLGSDDPKGPTFVWSRDNGTAVFPIASIDGADVTVTSLGRDRRLGLEVGDWVEVVDADAALRPLARRLHRVEDIDPLDLVVTLDPPVVRARSDSDAPGPTMLRRWDQQPPPAKEGGSHPGDGVPVGKAPVELEDGVFVTFHGGTYRTGDYWLIPARVATGDVSWPDGGDASAARPPFGVSYRYAPLAIVTDHSDPKSGVTDLRNVFKPLPYVD
jgi:hypothetical protein